MLKRFFILSFCGAVLLSLGTGCGSETPEELYYDCIQGSEKACDKLEKEIGNPESYEEDDEEYDTQTLPLEQNIPEDSVDSDSFENNYEV